MHAVCMHLLVMGITDERVSLLRDPDWAWVASDILKVGVGKFKDFTGNKIYHWGSFNCFVTQC